MTQLGTHKDLEVYFFADQELLLRWLESHHEKTDSIWIKLAKKGSGIMSITYEQARESAIRYGWIDGLINRWDDEFYLTKFSMRRKRSRWSKINRGIAEQLIGSGMMHAAGLRQVEAAQADGRWEAAYDSASTIQIPTALAKRLAENDQARAAFESLSSANRYAFLYRIQNAKRETTKRKHIDKTIAMLEAGEVYHPKSETRKS